MADKGEYLFLYGLAVVALAIVLPIVGAPPNATFWVLTVAWTTPFVLCFVIVPSVALISIWRDRKKLAREREENNPPSAR
jgi:hypothetical protein